MIIELMIEEKFMVVCVWCFGYVLVSFVMIVGFNVNGVMLYYYVMCELYVMIVGDGLLLIDLGG